MKTTFIETCIEILKKESNPTLQNIILLAEKELSEIKQAVEQSFAPAPPSACEDCVSFDEHIHYANCPCAKSAGR